MSFLNFHANFWSFAPKIIIIKKGFAENLVSKGKFLDIFLRWEANYKPEILAGGFRSISFTTVGL